MKKTGLIMLVFGLAAFSVAAQQKYALVIGNAEYRNIEKLVNTGNDAQDIAAALKRLGFTVDLKLNVNRLQFGAAIDAHVQKLAAAKGSEGFFWYAGHGVQIGDKNYLLPVDAGIESERALQRDSFSLNELLTDFEKAGNKVNVVVLDACRNNPLPSSSRGAGTRGLAVVQDVPSDLFVMFSTAAGAVADDGKGRRNSPFAEAFLKYIDSHEPLVLMVPDVVRETMARTNNAQRPFSRGSIISDKLYSLNPAPPAQTAAQPVPARTPPVQDNAVQDFQITASGNGLEIAKYKGNGGAVVIPAAINGRSVTSIGKEAFYYCTGLRSVTIPNSVTSIGNWAFSDCTGLTSVTIPDSATSIGDFAFRRCSGLTSVTIPDSVTTIGYEAFSGCAGLTSVTIPDSVTSIGRWAFYGCTGLRSVTIPDSVTSIGKWAFSDCTGLTSITIPDSVTSIGEGTFSGCKSLTSVTIPNSVTSIGWAAFADCTSLASVTIPNSVTSIGEEAFYGCSKLKGKVRADIEKRFGKKVFG
jgi:hypothetical protein